MLIIEALPLGGIDLTRPWKCRRVEGEPAATVFKPAGCARTNLENVELRLDELEAVRLADLEGLYQEGAAGEMGVSRATFGRLLAEAHRKIADALVNGKALIVKGGNVIMPEQREFSCSGCGHKWTVPFGTGRPDCCPSCNGTAIGRADRVGCCGQQKRRQFSGEPNPQSNRGNAGPRKRGNSGSGKHGRQGRNG